VAKLADARDLKSRDSKESYRFDSDPGHQAVTRLTACRRGWRRSVNWQRRMES